MLGVTRMVTEHASEPGLMGERRSLRIEHRTCRKAGNFGGTAVRVFGAEDWRRSVPPAGLLAAALGSYCWAYNFLFNNFTCHQI